MKYADKLKSSVGSTGSCLFHGGTVVFHLKQSDPFHDDTITEIGDDYIIVKYGKSRSFETLIIPLNLFVLIIE